MPFKEKIINPVCSNRNLKKIRHKNVELTEDGFTLNLSSSQ